MFLSCILALFIRFLAEIAAQIPKGLRKLHAFMPGRFGKLHVGGIFALFQKLTDTLYGFMPAYVQYYYSQYY